MTRRTAHFGVVIFMLGLAIPDVAAGDVVETRSAVSFGDDLLCLREDGTVRAWAVKTGVHDSETATRLSRPGLVALAADGDKLWSGDDSTAYRWSSSAKAWEKVGEL